MFKRIIAAAVLAVVVSGCSQKEEAPLDQTRSAPATTPQTPASTNSQKAAATSSQRTADPGKGNAQAAAHDSDHQPASAAQQGVSSTGTDSATRSTPAAQKSTKRKVAKASSTAQGAPPDAASRWSEFKALVARCETLTGDKRDRCLDDAKDAYRAAGLKCEALSDLDSNECMKYVERWNGGGNKQAITHTEAPAITPATPGDPTPAQRNRDSTVQQLDAAGALPESTRKD